MDREAWRAAIHGVASVLYPVALSITRATRTSPLLPLGLVEHSCRQSGILPLVEMPCFHKSLSALEKNPSAAKPLRENNFLKFSGFFTWRNPDSWLYFCKHSTLNYSFVFVTIF